MNPLSTRDAPRSSPSDSTELYSDGVGGAPGVRRRRSAWAPSANQCGVVIFVIIGCVSAVLTGTLIFNSSEAILRETAVERGESVVQSAQGQVQFHLERLNSTQAKLKQLVIEVTSERGFLPDTQETITLWNQTLFDFYSVNLGTVGEGLGGGAKLFYPPLKVPDSDALPPRVPGCGRICLETEPGTPYHKFTSMVFGGGWHENFERERKHQTQFPYATTMVPNSTSINVYMMDLNRSTTKSAKLGPLLYPADVLQIYVNGTFPQGRLDRPYLWTAWAGHPFYLFAFTQMYQINGNTVLIDAFDTFTSWFESITSIVKENDPDEIILLVDDLNRPIAFSHDPEGDARLLNCTLDPGDGTALCNALSAHDHPHWFVRSVFQHYNSSGTISNLQATSDWLDIEGRKMLLLSRRFVDQDDMHIVAFYGITEEKVIGEFLRKSIVTVVVCSIITAASAILLGVVAYVVIMDSHRYVRMAQDVSKYIVVYDITKALRTLSRYPSSSLRAQLEVICHNLACYKPFLPHHLHSGANTYLEDDDHFTSFGSLPSPPAANRQQQPQPQASGTSTFTVDSVDWDNRLQPKVMGGSMNGDVSTSSVVSAFGSVVNLSQLHKFKTIQSCTIVVAKLNSPDVLVVDDKKRGGAKAFADKVSLFVSSLVERIVDTHGVIDVLLGDELRASYGGHGTLLYHEKEACHAIMNLDEEYPLRDYDARVAIASGPCQSGLCGNLQLTARVLVGLPIVTAGALSAVQPTLGSRILASSRTVRHLPAHTSACGMYIPVDAVAFGPKQATVAFELLNNTIKHRLGEEDHTQILAFGGLLQEFAELRKPFLSEDGLTAAKHQMEHVKFNTDFGKYVHKWWKTLFASARMKEAPEDLLHHHLSMGISLPIPAVSASRESTKDSEAKRAEELLAKFAPKEVVENENGLFTIFSPDEPEESPADDAPATIAAMDGLDGGMLPNFTDAEDRTWMFVGKVLGKGSVGTVHTVMDVEGGRFAAAKVIPIVLNDLDVGVVAKEMRLLRELSHENICSYVGMGVAHDNCYILQELLPTANLDTLVKRGPLPPTTLRSLTSDILAALDYIHSRGVLHLDIKPANVLISGSGSAKLNDFGTAFLGSDASRSVTKLFASHRTLGAGKQGTENHVTGTNDDEDSFVLRGTNRYMAPEVARNEQPTAASDMWSFGITLLQMMTGQDPWTEHSQTAKASGEASNSSGGQQGAYQFVADLGNETKSMMPPTLERVVEVRGAKQRSSHLAPDLQSDEHQQTVALLIQLAKMCVVRNPQQRISASKAIAWAQKNGLMGSFS